MTTNLPTVSTPAARSARMEARDTDAGITVGSWWRVRDAADPLAARVDPLPAHGVVRALVAVHRIDGAIHSVDLHKHPLQGAGTDRVLYDAFLERCTPEANGAALRASEQSELLAELGAASARIAQGPDADTTARLLLAAEIADAAQVQPSTHLLPAALTGGRDASALSRAAEQAVALAGARAQWAKEQVDAMGVMAKTLTTFQTELAAVVHAQANAQAAGARGTLENLATLTLFLGERQTVTTLVDGPSADAEEPLHFFQQMLYLDEELAVAWPDDEGFTWYKGMGHLGDVLAQNPAIVARMLPQPRSVAIARIRRNPRPLPDTPADWAAVFSAIEQQEWDKALIILVRDGGRVAMVQADKDTADAQRLFPSRAEIDALYRERGWYGRDPIAITPDDLAYVESRAAHAQRALFYKRFLVLFWGLHARLGFFGPFMPTDSNWFDPAVQEAHFRFVHDEEFGLAAPGPNAVAWMAAAVEKAGVGARVAVDTAAALDDGILVGGYQDIDHRRLKGHAKERFLVTTIATDGLNRHIVIPMIEGRKTVLRKMLLSSEGRLHVPRGVCLLDTLTKETIDARLASRRDRVEYRSYVPLLRWLRPYVCERQETALAQLGVTDSDWASPAWEAARTVVKDGAPTRLPALAKAYARGLAAAERLAPALVSKTGEAQTLQPWSHPTFHELPTGLWAAGGQVCTAQHPAPNGWIQVGGLDAKHGTGLGRAFHRVDLPAWLDRVAAPSEGVRLGATLDGFNPEHALALLTTFIDHNRARKATRILPAICSWTLGIGKWDDVHHGARLLTLTAHHHPAAMALASCGPEVVHAQLKRLYSDPDKALERAKERAAKGAWITLGRADPRVLPPEGLGLDWDEGTQGSVVPDGPSEDAARGSDEGMLLGGSVERPAQFLFGGPGAAGYAQRAQSARFWLRASAQNWLAPRFHADGWSRDGITWFQG